MIKTAICKDDFLYGNDKRVEYLVRDEDKNSFKVEKILKKGDIIGVDFGENVGVEKSGIRPAVVVSNESFNKDKMIVVVAPLTSRIKNFDKEEQHIILSNKFYTKLKSTSVLQLEHVRSISKTRITNFIGELSTKSLLEMQTALIDMIIK